MTSNSYSDILAIRIEDEDFIKGSLDRTSSARPGKIFTASETLMVREVGILKNEVLHKVSDAVVRLFQANIPI